MKWSGGRLGNVFAVECFVQTNCVVNMLRAFGRELETATEGKCQQANSGVGESMARNRLCARRSLGEEGQL